MCILELEFNCSEEQLKKMIYDLYFTEKMPGYYLDPNPRRDLLGWLNLEVHSELKVGEGMGYNIVEIGCIKIHSVGNDVSMLKASDSNPAIKVFWDYLIDALNSILERTTPPEIIPPAKATPALQPWELPEWRPWEHMEGATKRDCLIVKLWWEFKTANEIGTEVFLGAPTIHNILSDLRKQYPKAHIPDNSQRKKLMRFRLGQ